MPVEYFEYFLPISPTPIVNARELISLAEDSEIIFRGKSLLFLEFAAIIPADKLKGYIGRVTSDAQKLISREFNNLHLTIPNGYPRSPSFYTTQLHAADSQPSSQSSSSSEISGSSSSQTPDKPPHLSNPKIFRPTTPAYKRLRALPCKEQRLWSRNSPRDPDGNSFCDWNLKSKNQHWGSREGFVNSQL